MNGRDAFISLATCMLSLQGALAAPPITAAAVSPDGKQLIVGSQAGVKIHEASDLVKVDTVKTDLDQVHDLQFSPDGKLLIIAGGVPGESGVVEIISWPAREKIKTIAIHKDLIYRVAWSPAGSEFATASADGSCCVFAYPALQEQTRYTGHSRSVLAIAYLPDGQSLVSAGVDRTLQLWDCRTGQRIRALDNHLGPVNDLAVRPHVKPNAPPVVVSVSEDRTVRLWQPTIGRLMRFAKLESVPRAAVWSSDGSRIVVGCDDGCLREINPDTIEVGKDKASIGGRIHALLAGPQEKWLIGGEQSELRLVK